MCRTRNTFTNGRYRGNTRRKKACVVFEGRHAHVPPTLRPLLRGSLLLPLKITSFLLLGTLPVIFLVTPLSLAGSFLIKGPVAPFPAMFNIAMAFSAITQVRGVAHSRRLPSCLNQPAHARLHKQCSKGATRTRGAAPPPRASTSRLRLAQVGAFLAMMYYVEGIDAKVPGQ